MAKGAKTAKPWRLIGWIRTRSTAARRPQTQPYPSADGLAADPHDEQMEREWRERRDLEGQHHPGTTASRS
jgi:hypothetical protein